MCLQTSKVISIFASATMVQICHFYIGSVYARQFEKKNEHNLAPCKNYLFVKCYQGFKISCIFFFCLLGEQVCTKNIYGVRAVVACLPAWFRFAQCLRRYRDTKLVFPHVVNAGKYSTTFFVQLFAALYKVHVGL